MTQDYERKGGIHSKVNTKEYEDNYDKIFSKEIPCCGGSTLCTAPCMFKKQLNSDKGCKDEDNTCCSKK